MKVVPVGSSGCEREGDHRDQQEQADAAGRLDVITRVRIIAVEAGLGMTVIIAVLGARTVKMSALGAGGPFPWLA